MDYALENGVNFFDTAEMYSIPANKDTYRENYRNLA
jgi:aryl-alcohol dehydrogenase-like predicted oxidoreductase